MSGVIVLALFYICVELKRLRACECTRRYTSAVQQHCAYFKGVDVFH